MYLSQLRAMTEGMPDDTSLVIMNTQDGETHVIEDISVIRDINLVYVEASI